LQPFRLHVGVAAHLPRANVDTDAIIPSREMRSVSRRGLGQALFAGWRYHHEGMQRLGPDEDFVLNRPANAGATILLAGANFGCGSSREHAVWALADYGFRALIAPSFGAIFQGNCARNGVLAVELPAAAIDELAAHVAPDPQARRLAVDLERCEVRTDDGRVWTFMMAPAVRERLLQGLDEVAETLQHRPALEAWRERDRRERPWVYGETQA
jgi:3-isopropylmalate/(R)-2-methylmalate dehydratase small subunit